jgi:hypothetical protein
MKIDLKNYVADSLENSLSENYWDIVCAYLYKYHQRDDVLESDMLGKYVDGEWFDDEEDYEHMVNEYGNKLTAKVHLKTLDTGLYIEALERFKEVYAREIALVVSIIQNEKLISGSLRESFDKAYEIACAYVVRHQPSSETDKHFCVVSHTIYEEGSLEDMVIRFAKHCIEEAIPTDDNYLSY